MTWDIWKTHVLKIIDKFGKKRNATLTTFHTFSPNQNISVFLLRPARLSYFRSPYSSYRGRYASRVGGSRGYRTRSYRSQGNFNWSWRNRLLSRLEVEHGTQCSWRQHGTTFFKVPKKYLFQLSALLVITYLFGNILPSYDMEWWERLYDGLNKNYWSVSTACIVFAFVLIIVDVFYRHRIGPRCVES